VIIGLCNQATQVPLCNNSQVSGVQSLTAHYNSYFMEHHRLVMALRC